MPVAPVASVTYVSLDARGRDDAAETVNNGTILSLESLRWSTPDGYLFVEWNTERDGSGTAYSAGDVTKSKITLYTIWEKRTVNKVVLGSETLLDLTSDTATAEDVAEGKTFHLASGAQAVGTASGGSSGVIPFGYVDSRSTATEFTATVEGVTELVDGTCVMLHNGVVTSASGFTVNVNDLGAKPVYNNMATGNDVTPTNPTRDTTIFNINYTMLFVYDSQLEGGAWICYRGYDANTNTIGYQLRTNSGNRPMADAAYRYRLYFTSADGSKWVPANTSTSTDATTSRTLNTRAIDPFGPIVYNSTNGTTSSGARPAVTTLWQQYALTIGYSYVKSLTAWDSVWLKCQPNTDGSAVMKDMVQALPTSKDGYIYILLGFAYSTTAMELRAEHPVYWHDGTGIRLWNGAEPSSGGDVSMTEAEVDAAVDSAFTYSITNPYPELVSVAANAVAYDTVQITNVSSSYVDVSVGTSSGGSDVASSGSGIASGSYMRFVMPRTDVYVTASQNSGGGGSND